MYLPSAGMTRIRFYGRHPGRRMPAMPSQPVCGLPWFPHSRHTFGGMRAGPAWGPYVAGIHCMATSNPSRTIRAATTTRNTMRMNRAPRPIAVRAPR